MKKTVVFFTNCQGEFIYNNFLQSIPFFNDYDVTFIPNYIPEKIDRNIISKSDIFIYQPVNNYTVNATEKDNLILLLKPECIKICFPSVYIDIWPFYNENGKYCGGNVMLDFKSLGYTLDELLQMYNSDTFSFDLKNRFNKSLTYLKQREEYCDIKISSFINENYKKYRLFTTQMHPNGIIGSYLAKEICNHLNVDFPNIDIFLQEEITVEKEHIGFDNDGKKVDFTKLRESRYMTKELDLEYKVDDNNNYYYSLIMFLYNNPSSIKYKNIYNGI